VREGIFGVSEQVEPGSGAERAASVIELAPGGVNVKTRLPLKAATNADVILPEQTDKFWKRCFLFHRNFTQLVESRRYTNASPAFSRNNRQPLFFVAGSVTNGWCINFQDLAR
jgi:hypothetical protein